MDPIIGGALIGGGANIASGVMGGKAAEKAAKAQERSAAAALAFAREQEAEQKRRYDQGYGQFNQQTADWYAARNALLGRYGVDINLGSGGIPTAGPAPAAAPTGDLGSRWQAYLASNPGGSPVSRVAGFRASESPYQGKTLGEIAQPDVAVPGSNDWADWSRYNLGRNA